MTLSEPEIGALIATLARATGLVATAPVIADNGIPMRARLVLVIAIVAAIGPSRAGVPLAEVGGVAILELAVGLLTGLAARFIMARAAIAGQLFGLSLGLGFAAQFDLHAGESAGTLRSLVTTVAGLVFISAGGLEAIVQSAAAAPASATQLAALGPMLLEQGTSAFVHGVSLAAPVLLAALVGNIGFALVSRAAPAANMFSFALAGVLVLGGVTLLGGAGELVHRLDDHARAAIDIFTTGSP